MILRIFILILEPVNPLQFYLTEFRSSLARQFAEYPALTDRPPERFIYRYPAIQCKQVKGVLMVIGISQGADFLRQMSEENREIMPGKNHCTIVSQDPEIRDAEFGITGGIYEYEFLTPWLALNQQHAKKFYDLNGKPVRDAFMQKILTAHLNTLAKSLDYAPTEPIICTAHVRFRREQNDNENVMVFLGKFRTNLCIPDYLGIGQSVSHGFGTLREIPGTSELHQNTDHSISVSRANARNSPGRTGGIPVGGDQQGNI
jgi:hypothetical protein